MSDLGSHVGELDLESLRSGAIHRIRVEMISDGAGYPVLLPVMVARGKKDGPTLGIISTVHGDELNGIAAIHRLFERLEPGRLSGNVVGVLVSNYPGFDRQQRRFIDGVDLNHCVPGRADGSASAVYVHRFIERIVRRFDVMIDLHTASRGRINSLYARANLKNETCARLAHLLRPQIILHSKARDGTMRGEASAMNIPSVTLEIGNPARFQPEFLRATVRGLRTIMSYLGMVKSKPAAEGKEPIICARSHWIYTDEGGLLTVHPALCDRVERGASLATLTNIFGDVTRRYEMPESGVIIGKAVNPAGYTGARIAHVGVEATSSFARDDSGQ